MCKGQSQIRQNKAHRLTSGDACFGAVCHSAGGVNHSYGAINATFVTAMVKGDAGDHWSIKWGDAQARAGAANGSHSMRSAALSSQRHTHRFGYVMRRSPLPTKECPKKSAKLATLTPTAHFE